MSSDEPNPVTVVPPQNVVDDGTNHRETIDTDDAITKLKQAEEQLHSLTIEDSNRADTNDPPKSVDTNCDPLKESIYATPLRKLDRPNAAKPPIKHSDSTKAAAHTSASADDTNGIAPEDRHILNFLKDSSKLQKKLQRNGGSGNNSSGDGDYGKANFSSLAQEQHFVNLVQQNVIGYRDGGAAGHLEAADASAPNDSQLADLQLAAANGPSAAAHTAHDTGDAGPKTSAVLIKREWIIKLIALCLEQRLSKQSAQKPADDGVADGPAKKSTGSSSSRGQPKQSQYTGVMLLGSNGSGKTSICQRIISGSSGTQGMLNRKLLSCYFINAQDPECHALSTFIRCIVMQILSHSTLLSSREDVDAANASKTSADLNQSAESTDGPLDSTLDDTTPLITVKENKITAKEIVSSAQNAINANAGAADNGGGPSVDEKPSGARDEKPPKMPVHRQQSETAESNTSCNRDSTYDTYPPPSQKQAETVPATPSQCSTPAKTKSMRVTSKIPVKASSIPVKAPAKVTTPVKTKSNSSITLSARSSPRSSPLKKAAVNAATAVDPKEAPVPSAPPAEADKEPANGDDVVAYENIEIHRKAEEPPKTIAENVAATAAEPGPPPHNGPLASECEQPQPPPKTKSSLQMLADEYFTILQQTPEIMDSLNADNIEKNPDECFKKAILYPFLELQPPKTALLFLVDAVDEHYINEEENVISTLRGNATNKSRSIAELLANHFHLMPKWLFLVLTAKRQSRHIVKRFAGFKKIALDDLRKSHVVKDVQEYIIARLNADFKGQIQFSTDIIDCLNQLYIKSNGSILYLEKVLSGVRDNVFSFREIKLIPCTLNGLYLYICQKSFNKKQYTKIRPILNVLLASSDFVDLSFVLNCLRTLNYSIDQPEFDKRIEAMRYVLTLSECRTKVKIFHSSFSDWLSDVKFSTKKFLCSVNEGHAMISMYYTLVSHTLCPNRVLRYFGHLLKCDEYAKTKTIGMDLILVLLESRANLVDCFYVNALSCCGTCELDYKQTYCTLPRMMTVIDRYLNKSLADEVMDFVGDFYKPSLPVNAKVLKLLIETGINNAECQFSYDSLISSPITEDNNDELAKLLINSEKLCQRNNSKELEEEEANEYQEIMSPVQSPTQQHGDGGRVAKDAHSADDLSGQHQLLSNGKALIHLLANEGNVAMLHRALNACKKDGNGLATIDLEVEDECGQTPLNIAARNGHYDIVELLLSLRYISTSTNQIKRVYVNHADRDGWTPLRSASWGGHHEVVKLLIRHPEIQIDLADKEQRTALRAASWSGHEDILKALIAAGANVNSIDKQGRTSLIAASYMGHYEIVEILLENGADVNHLDIDGRSALCVAALCGSSGYSRVISILLEYHANADQQDNDGMSSLLVSAFEGNAEVCELLLENGADPDLADNMGRTPLWAACTKGHANIVKLLLFWGCSIDCMDTEGRTVLSIAAAQGNPESVRQLLDRGLDETHRDNAGWTALHYAAFEGYDDVCLQLIEAGAKIYECDNEGKNAVHIAAQEGRNNVIETLVTATKVCIDQKAHDGKTAFRLACIEGNIECIDSLIKYGCDVNLRDADGRPTLYILALENNVTIAKYLMENSNINVNLPDNEGRTPLHVSSWQGHLEMVELLVSQGCADVNAMDLDFRSALHSSAWQGNDRVMEMLLYYGASCDHACKQGATALGISAQEGHEQCVATLLQYGANPHKSDHCGRTPIKLAMKSNNFAILRLLENAIKNEEAKAKQQHRNSGVPHKLIQSPPEKKSNGTVFYENTLRSDASANNNLQLNRKSVISSHSTGSSNNETTGASTSTHKNYQASHASSRTTQQLQPHQAGRNRSSMSSHSDIFMKADEQKINFDLSDMGCMSPLYATPPISPGSDNGQNFDETFEAPSTIFSSQNIENNDHFARDTHMRIILGNSKDMSQSSKKSLKRSGITTNPAVRLLRNRFDAASQLIRRTNNMLSSSNHEGSSSNGVKSTTFQWRKESQIGSCGSPMATAKCGRQMVPNS